MLHHGPEKAPEQPGNTVHSRLIGKSAFPRIKRCRNLQLVPHFLVGNDSGKCFNKWVSHIFHRQAFCIVTGFYRRCHEWFLFFRQLVFIHPLYPNSASQDPSFPAFRECPARKTLSVLPVPCPVYRLLSQRILLLFGLLFPASGWL